MDIGRAKPLHVLDITNSATVNTGVHGSFNCGLHYHVKQIAGEKLLCSTGTQPCALG